MSFLSSENELNMHSYTNKPVEPIENVVAVEVANSKSSLRKKIYKKWERNKIEHYPAISDSKFAFATTSPQKIFINVSKLGNEIENQQTRKNKMKTLR